MSVKATTFYATDPATGVVHQRTSKTHTYSHAVFGTTTAFGLHGAGHRELLGWTSRVDLAEKLAASSAGARLPYRGHPGPPRAYYSDVRFVPVSTGRARSRWSPPGIGRQTLVPRDMRCDCSNSVFCLDCRSEVPRSRQLRHSDAGHPLIPVHCSQCEPAGLDRLRPWRRRSRRR